MKNVLIILLVLFQFSVPARLSSQGLNIGFESGLGSFKMDELKELNDLLLNFLPFEAKITEEFPMYWYYKPSLIYSFPKAISLGIVWSYQSTGSRISRADYSGEYYFDTRIRASSPGILFQLNSSFNKFQISFFNETGVEFSKLGLKEYLSVDSEKLDEEYVFTSINYYDEAGIKMTYPVSVLRLGLVAGYLFDFRKGDFSYSGSNNMVLNISGGKEATADWTGIRLGVSISYSLFQDSKSKE